MCVPTFGLPQQCTEECPEGSTARTTTNIFLQRIAASLPPRSLQYGSIMLAPGALPQTSSPHPCDMFVSPVTTEGLSSAMGIPCTCRPSVLLVVCLGRSLHSQ